MAPRGSRAPPLADASEGGRFRTREEGGENRVLPVLEVKDGEHLVRISISVLTETQTRTHKEWLGAYSRPRR